MASIQQPHLIAKISQKFGRLTKHLQAYKTPGTPGLGTLKNPKTDVDPEKHKIYRSGVGMLLYLVNIFVQTLQTR